MLRVGGGSARGRLLKSPACGRPTLGRVKRSLFDILAPRLEGARFLDVFAGSGAVGIEALSRGAAWAVFIEAQPRSAALIRQNLARCGFSDKAAVLCAEAERGLARLGRRGEAFDLLFLDPPYEESSARLRALEKIAENPALLLPGAIIIAERARRIPRGDLPVADSPGRNSLEVFDSRTIGDSALDFLRQKRMNPR